MDSNLEITVEFLAGTSIEQAVAEAKEKAIKFDVAYIVFNFNGTRLSIGKTANIDDVINQYRENNQKYIVAA